MNKDLQKKSPVEIGSELNKIVFGSSFLGSFGGVESRTDDCGCTTSEDYGDEGLSRKVLETVSRQTVQNKSGDRQQRRRVMSDKRETHSPATAGQPSSLTVVKIISLFERICCPSPETRSPSATMLKGSAKGTESPKAPPRAAPARLF